GHKKEYSRQKLFVLLIAAVVVAFVGIVVVLKLLPAKQPIEMVRYNQFDFIKSAGSWFTQWQYGKELYTIPFRFNPYEVENVSITGSLDEAFNEANVTFITFDPDTENLTYVALGAAELSISLAQVLGVNLEAACTKNVTGPCTNRTIITCEEANKRGRAATAVIYIRESEKPEVVFNGRCVIVQGRQLELVKAVDRLLYKWYGIMS
ncbi:MAG: hypothetical protein QXU88_01230, partial [Candidatus Woesearchaeota archaeon]